MESVIKIHDKSFKIFIKREKIQDEVRRLAKTLDNEIEIGKQSDQDFNPIFIAVLNGAFMFASDLIRTMNQSIEMHFIKISSYSGTSSTGKISLDYIPNINLEGRDIFIIEDIVETGYSIDFLEKYITKAGAKSIKIVSLLYKPDSSKSNLKPDYYCFSIGQEFVVGYGLDYKQKGRDLADLWVLHE